MSDATVSSDLPDASLFDPRRILISAVVFMVLLFGAAAVLGYWFREPLEWVSLGFIRWFGGPGVAIGFFVPDAFTIPLPNDTFGLFGLAGGMGFWTVCVWATAGSVLGGSVGWLIGRRLRKTRWVDGFMSGRGNGLEVMIRRYGLWVVAIAAVTPLPYSLASWAAGAARMPFVPFVLVSLSRVFRVAASLYLIQLGLLGG